MKKVLLIIVFLIGFYGVYAQKSSLNVDFGYRFDVEYIGKWGFGAEYQYKIMDNFRLAPGTMFYWGDVKSLDIQANLHYLISVNDEVTVYPLAGIVMANNNFNAEPKSRSTTEWGLNFGAGGEYNVLNKNYLVHYKIHKYPDFQFI